MRNLTHYARLHQYPDKTPSRCLKLKTSNSNPTRHNQVLSMISSNTVERQIRGDFILRCNISSERSRADEICASSEFDTLGFTRTFVLCIFGSIAASVLLGYGIISGSLVRLRGLG